MNNKNTAGIKLKALQIHSNFLQMGFKKFPVSAFKQSLGVSSYTKTELKNFINGKFESQILLQALENFYKKIKLK